MQLASKYCRDISGIEDKVISLYARGITTRDIGAEIKEWQSCPLDHIYPFVFMDAIHYKMREDGRILNRAALCNSWC